MTKTVERCHDADTVLHFSRTYKITARTRTYVTYVPRSRFDQDVAARTKCPTSMFIFPARLLRRFYEIKIRIYMLAIHRTA